MRKVSVEVSDKIIQKLPMKKNIVKISCSFIILSVFATISVSCTTVKPVTDINTAAETTAEADRRYPELKAAMIKYNVSGMNTGTETVYIDDWGRREAIYRKITTKMMGVTIERDSMTLIAENGKWVYNVDLSARTAVKMNQANYKALLGSSGTNMDKVIGAMKVGTEEVAGKACEVWERNYPYSKAWMWKGVALKKDQDVAAMRMITVATDVQENVFIPEDKFVIPPDVKVKSMTGASLLDGG